MDELLTKKLQTSYSQTSAFLRHTLLPLAFALISTQACSAAPAPTKAADTTINTQEQTPKAIPATPSVAPAPKTSAPSSVSIDKELEKLSREMNIPLADLRYAAKQAKLQNTILKTMDKPWEAKPWYKYWPIFIIPKRISEGVVFWDQNAATLNEASRIYGVPPEIILAIIGVETFYGKNMGSFRVLDALYTLGFYYPKRAEYFSHEFANYVKLATKEKWNYNEIKGSYAGAMGMGQFMPWSYLTWAVDFNHNGHIDLFHEKADAIGSVANYFKEHGWERNGHTVYKLTLNAQTQKIADTLLTDGLELKKTVRELRQAGLTLPSYYRDEEPCRLIKLEEEHGWTYYVGFGNFKAITGYNRSPLYAMTVYLLSQDLKKAHDAKVKSSTNRSDSAKKK